MSPASNEQSGTSGDLDKVFDALEARLGSFYNTWKSGDGWRGSPIWGDRTPTVAQAKNQGGVCSSVPNIAAHLSGLLPPGPLSFRGGTGNWHAFARQHGEVFGGAGTILEPGDILISPFQSDKLAEQGHTGIVRTRGLPKDAKLYHWWTKGGLRKDQSVAQVNAMLAGPSKWTHIIRREAWQKHLREA